MKEIYEKVIELCENKHFSVMATIIRQTGSAPRGVGTKFVIMEDGSFVGTIGGGRLEAQVLKEAKKVFKTLLPVRLNFILKGTDVPVIPVYLEGLWGSVFSFEGGRFFWKMPRKWPYPVTIRFGRPIPTPKDVEQVRRAVEALGGNGKEELPVTSDNPS